VNEFSPKPRVNPGAGLFVFQRLTGAPTFAPRFYEERAPFHRQHFHAASPMA
jgi:hypothetical protein